MEVGHRPHLGSRKKDPVGAQGRLRSRVGSFPESRLVLEEVTEALCAAGERTSSETDVGVAGLIVEYDCGCFPRASHTPGESAFYDGPYLCVN